MVISHLKKIARDERILLPVDVTVRGPQGVTIKTISEVSRDETIVDAGPKTIEFLDEYITPAKNILWNGPIGNYEEGFFEYTEELAKLVSETDGVTVVGGGDTVASIEELELDEKFTFVSAAGEPCFIFLSTAHCLE